MVFFYCLFFAGGAAYFKGMMAARSWWVLLFLFPLLYTSRSLNAELWSNFSRSFFFFLILFSLDRPGIPLSWTVLSLLFRAFVNDADFGFTIIIFRFRLATFFPFPCLSSTSSMPHICPSPRFASFLFVATTSIPSR